MTVPPAAVTAAAGAIYDLLGKPATMPDDRGQAANRLARAAVTAAAPLIEAAERERILAVARPRTTSAEGTTP